MLGCRSISFDSSKLEILLFFRSPHDSGLLCEFFFFFFVCTR